MPTTPPDSLANSLKQIFGFDTFRPLQREIMEEILAGRDAFALLPTGGGKSLCFQIPGLLLPRLTVVVSPLIALMKDQVDSLHAAGVAATYLNSSLTAAESSARLRGLHAGQYKLLYLAPERLMLSGVLEDLQRWGVSLLAIDEAHCISEWGHDFRPEYRQIAALRNLFPKTPLLALTATATPRVREDIVTQLRLEKARRFVASFNRPNLTYRVEAKSKSYEKVRFFIKSRRSEAGIIYCQSRKGAEELASKLADDGIPALPYHAGLTTSERAKNQELFLRDKTNVICATIAFGMGINKSNVRFVIHYDLPKNIEGYYQETGRAGRDGLPSECLLLYSSGDAVKQRRFIDEKTDPEERRIALEQLQQILHYAEAEQCRRSTLLDYFGETGSEGNCGGCDNCILPREPYPGDGGTLLAQKLLSCVLRIRQAAGFSVGMAHIAEVLVGAKTEKIIRWHHDQLSTYGIGRDIDRRQWQEIGRQLLRMGILQQQSTSSGFATIELSSEGMAILRDRRQIRLTKPITPSTEATRAPSRAVDRGDIVCDEQLFNALRTLRRTLADERNVPAYVIFSDVTLRLMAREQPSTLELMSSISGIGQKKLSEFGETFISAIRDHLAERK
ncbi:MAG: DNA helicase RecQ [Chthoniobacterales bacterium]|nr:DNA helicase RecQ [Chthoniobacterales bacterium]